jgi:ABC-type lipoprotein export system ATPase subunit
LDDPISALDIHVGKFVMEECIVKYLRGKTRVVATHALPYLPYFDEVIIID